MANDVFANGREISCKAADGKAVCAFPDVCFTPPQTPATPPGVPIPYPNTAFAKDTAKGSKKVKISKKPVMLKNKSHFKTSTGDEAGCAPKKGVVTSKIKGKVYFNMWSMDVKVEGKNVVRHLDLTTHNHGSQPGQTPPWPYLDSMAFDRMPEDHPCKKDAEKEKEACKDLIVHNKKKDGSFGKINGKKTKQKICADTAEGKKCQEAQKCKLTPYKPNRCCKGQTGHHLIEVHSFCERGRRGTPIENKFPDYNMNKAPVVCAKCEKGSRYDKEHGQLHAYQGTAELDAIGAASDKEFAWKYKDARQAGVEAHQSVFKGSDDTPACDQKCLEKQLDAYHKDEAGVGDSDDVRTETPPLQNWQKKWGRDAVDSVKPDCSTSTSVGM